MLERCVGVGQCLFAGDREHFLFSISFSFFFFYNQASICHFLAARTENLYWGLDGSKFSGLRSFSICSISHFDQCLCILTSQQKHSGPRSSVWPSQQTSGKSKPNTAVKRMLNGSSGLTWGAIYILASTNYEMTTLRCLRDDNSWVSIKCQVNIKKNQQKIKRQVPSLWLDVIWINKAT